MTPPAVEFERVSKWYGAFQALREVSLTIKQGLASALIDRRLEAAFPPMPLYGLTGNGLRLSGALRM